MKRNSHILFKTPWFWVTIITVATLLLFSPDLEQLLNTENPLVRTYTDDFRDGGQRAKQEALSVSGQWAQTPGYLALMPGGQASITYRFFKQPEEKVKLQVWLAQDKNLKTRLTINSPAGQYLITRPLKGQPIWLDQARRQQARSEKQEILVSLHATHLVKQVNPVPVLDKLSVIVYSRQAIKYSRLWGILGLIITPLLIFYLLSLLLDAPNVAWLSSALSFLILLVLSKAYFPFLSIIIYLYVVLLFFFYVICLVKGRKRSMVQGLRGRESKLTCFTILGIILLGAILRWEPLIERIGYLLDPDAQDFFTLSTTMTSPFSSELPEPPYVREPLFAWLISLWFLLVPDSKTSLRILTMLFSLALIPMTYYLGRTLFNHLIGLGAALLVAISPVMIFQANRGLRLELYLLLISGFLILLFSQLPRTKKAWLSGLLGGLSSLTRLSSISLLVPIVILMAIKQKWKIKEWLICFGLWFIIILPHLWFNYHHFPEHDPLFSANIHARFFRNLEFKGQPGFPTLEEVKQNPWAGQHITMLAYLFKLHSIKQLLHGSLMGIKRIFFTTHALEWTLSSSWLLYILYLLGLLSLVVQRRWEILVLMIFLVAPAIYLASVGVDWRLVSQLSLFIYCCVILGPVWLVANLRRLYKGQLAKSKEV